MRNMAFVERLHYELDEIGMPEQYNERIAAFAKLIHKPLTVAESILDGHISPDEQLIQLLAEEFEVESDWLLGKDSSTEH